MTFTCRLAIHFDGAAVSVVFALCLFSSQAARCSTVLRGGFSVDPRVGEDYMCSAGVAHLPPLTGGNVTEQSASVFFRLKPKENHVHIRFVCSCVYVD